MNKALTGDNCKMDSECSDGYVCDKSTGCGCCVEAPLVAKPTDDTNRVFWSFCQTTPRRGCTPPRDIANCTLKGEPFTPSPATAASTLVRGDVLVCELTNTAPQFTSPYSSTNRHDALAQLCVKHEKYQECMWEVKLGPAGALDMSSQQVVDKGYECGARSCNDEPVFLVAPEAGKKYEITLVDDSVCDALP